ncbi:MAG TPA: right-handed parallel beta-helix repeat-containing protein [Candidatus Krumholzibacteria bacterium]|nr:right-handed parallel beta-helix repeat-containing protein [Candidatus Krumholzibacteria bacterium]HPD72676.1 right-handed parallel beta-helix repeat-containing protein [Candidatus Krumholzibacteria bacterium]HRY40392.1 right-handed parallel beta-helix repeat-containing protein [Candidatus Krumholzibacteria bacterium]
MVHVIPPFRRAAAGAFAAFVILTGVAPALADYATPGTGVAWTMDDLVANSAGAVTGAAGSYQVHQTVVVSLGDRLTIAPGSTLVFQGTAGAIGLTINGALRAEGTAPQPIVFTGVVATPGAWRGLDYADTGAGSEFHLRMCDIAYAVEAIDVVGGDVDIHACEVRASSSKALDISSGDGTITSCSFRDNRQRTITMTLSSSPTIEACHLENNNLDNASPYPYINIGLQGVNSPTIRGNTIIGSGHHLSGGISVWALSNAVIEYNTIQGCGYGILCYSAGANPVIRDNLIVDNNIHPDTLNWGFGIACNGDNAPIVAGNRIHGHWYGVAAINGGRPNLGDLTNGLDGDDGGNLITGNGLGDQVYGFYNNTPLSQMAQGNWWGAYNETVVEDAIWHQVDDPALGLVDYDYFLEIAGVGEEVPTAGAIAAVTAFPNPFNPRVDIRLELTRPGRVSVTVVDLAGRLLRELGAGELGAGEHVFAWDGADREGRPLASGLYFYRVTAGAESRTGKLALVR